MVTESPGLSSVMPTLEVFEMVAVSPALLVALRFLIGIMQKMSVRMPRMMIAVRSVMLAVALQRASNLTRTDGVVVQQRS